MTARSWLAVSCCTMAALWAAPATAQQWSFLGSVAEGNQFDAVVAPGGTIHVISTTYAQLDITGTAVVTEPVADGLQGMLDFPPAIAVGTDGTVHVVTRHGGNYDTGHDIRYRRRDSSGNWDRDYLVGTPVKRNYVVAAAWASPSEIYLLSSQAGVDVWGDLHLWSAGESSASAVGDLSGIWRADCDARMRGQDGRVYVVTGKPDSGGAAYALFANAGSSLRDDLVASQQAHASGDGRRGFADLSVDGMGGMHLVYGAEQTAFYNQYGLGGQRVHATDVQTFAGLGTWHMSAGLSALAASADGTKLVTVGLRSDGSQQAADSDLMWSYSLDGGATWSSPADLGRNTNGGEGRHRPRLLAIGSTFALLYTENGTSGISMATLALATDQDEDGFDEDVDCNDTNDTIYPGATELCNGVDDNCDGDTDEGCSCTDGDTRECGSDVGACALGTETCANEQWGPCEGQNAPAPELCDGLDNDCDGETDEECSDAGVPPSPGSSTPPAGESDGGCGCRLASRQRSTAGWSLTTAIAAVALAGRRRRCRRLPRPARTD